MVFRVVLCGVVLILGSAAAGAELWWPDGAHPAAAREHAPAWLLEEKLCFSRWDGGPIEVCKGVLSGWTYFNPPWPAVLDATNRWYDPPTAALAGEMGYNFLWLTLSVGFPVEQEEVQWQRLRPYVAACRQRGIRVAAYMSLTNMFVDGMFAHVPESRSWLLRGDDGEPVPYGAAAYEKMGRTTRMLADISHPEWRAYLKRRIDAAIDLGFDAIEYDNISYRIGGDETARKRYARFLEKNGFSDTPDTRRFYEHEQVRRTFAELLAHARGQKPDMVIFCNAHWNNVWVSRSNTIIGTEDGSEPGYYAPEQTREYVREAEDDLIEPAYADVVVEDPPATPNPGHFHSNLALLRGMKGMSDGWKPVLVEFGKRRHGNRFMNQMPPASFQLAVAECNAALCSLQGFQEGRALLDLYRRAPEVRPIIDAAAQAHAFVKQAAEHVVGARYLADVAVVMGPRMQGRALLERLALDNVQYEVLVNDAVNVQNLGRFQRVVACDARMLSDAAVAALVTHAEGGGRLLVCGESGESTEYGQPRADNPLAKGGPWQRMSGEADLDAMVGFCTEGVERRFEVIGNPYVLFTLTEHPERQGYVAHLLNYLKTPLEHVEVRCDGEVEQLLGLTPAMGAVLPGEAPGVWRIPLLGIYTMALVGPGTE